MIVKTIKVLEDELISKINNLKEGESIILGFQDKQNIIRALQCQNAMDEILDVALDLKKDSFERVEI